MECSHCGSDHIMSDYFEDEWIYWCGVCLREVYLDDDITEQEASFPRTERETQPDSIPGVHRAQD